MVIALINDARLFFEVHLNLGSSLRAYMHM
jgi:hypothetical protein